MADILKYGESGLEYLKAKGKVLFSNGVLIDEDAFNAYDAAGTMVRNVKELENSPDHAGFQWDRAVQTGIFSRNPSPFAAAPRRPRVVATEEVQVAAPKPTIEVATPPKKVVTPVKEKNAAGDIVFWVMLIVALGSGIMSATNTALFRIQSGAPVWQAWMTGIIMILFSATAFTAARYFLQEKNASMIFGVVFIVFGCAIICYSMFSTIAVNFELYKWNEITASAAVEVESAPTHEAEIKLLQGEIDGLERSYEQTALEAEYWKEKSWRRYDEFVEQMRTMRGEISARRADLTGLKRGDTDAQALLYEQNRDERRANVYSFLNTLFGLDEDTLRFLVYTIPAVFYDVFSAVGFAVVLLLHDRRKENA